MIEPYYADSLVTLYHIAARRLSQDVLPLGGAT